MAQPGFWGALRAMAASVITSYRGNWLLNRLVNDRGRVITTLVIMDLHFQNGGKGCTLTQIREEARRYGFCSPNRASALVGSLRLSGFLRMEQAKDGRVRRLLPTERLLSLQRQRLRDNFGAQLPLRPELRAAIAALETEEFLGAFMHSYIGLWKQGLRATHHIPTLESLVERDAAFIIMVALVTKDEGTMSLSELARLFMVSRSHVASIMREAQGSGLVIQDASRAGFSPTPALVEAVGMMIATMFLAQAKSAEQALLSCGQVAASA